MESQVSIGTLIIVCTFVGCVAGGILFIRKESKDVVDEHNQNATAHTDLRSQLSQFTVRFEEYVERHEAFVNEKTKDILDEIRAAKDHE